MTRKRGGGGEGILVNYTIRTGWPSKKGTALGFDTKEKKKKGGADVK